MADIQTERAFQKQTGVFLNSKKLLAKKTTAGVRYFKKIGLGHYVDKKCPFTSTVSIRGRIFKGVVLSTKMKRTIIIRRDYLHYVKKYTRFEKRHNNFSVHCSPAFRVREGDVVTVGQPLSKTVRFNVLRVEAKRIIYKYDVFFAENEIPNFIVYNEWHFLFLYLRIEGNVRKQFVLF